MHVILKPALTRLVNNCVNALSEVTIRYRLRNLDWDEFQEDLNQNLKNNAVKAVENL